jgi:serine-type D-Ala-D-Ala carboxypeptidase
VFHENKIVLNECVGACTRETIFDLASLTKVISTTALFVSLWSRGELSPDAALRDVLPATAAHADTTLADLLFHRSGMPASVPYFEQVMKKHPSLLTEQRAQATFEQARADTFALAMKTAPAQALRTQAVYSDVNFILLGEVLSKVAGSALDTLFNEAIAKPLSLRIHFRPLGSSASSRDNDIAPTGDTRPRPPAPGQEGTWNLDARAPSLPGEVDDDNAWCMNGIAGHAGVFGTATDVAKFGQAVLEELVEARGRLALPPLWQQVAKRDASVSGSTRAMGFDMPSLSASSAGRHFSRKSIGHLGFTGTSLWIDPERKLVVALVTNRVAFGRDNISIRDFRPKLHDAVVEALTS